MYEDTTTPCLENWPKKLLTGLPYRRTRKLANLSLVEDWNSKISYGLRAIHEQQGVHSRWLARVDAI